MRIEKTTEKYDLIQEGASYVIDFGETKRAEDKSVYIIVKDVEDAKRLTLSGTCGCTTTERTVVDKTSASFKITYSDCDKEFKKIAIVKYDNIQLTTILLKGRCQ